MSVFIGVYSATRKSAIRTLHPLDAIQFGWFGRSQPKDALP